MKKPKRRFLLRPVMLVVVVLALVGAAGLGTVAYAQATRASASAARPDTFFNPFTLTRASLSPDDSTGFVVLAANPGNNGIGPPPGVPGPPIFVPGRAVYRSLWCPPFGRAVGRNGI